MQALTWRPRSSIRCQAIDLTSPLFFCLPCVVGCVCTCLKLFRSCNIKDGGTLSFLFDMEEIRIKSSGGSTISRAQARLVGAIEKFSS